MKITVLKQDIKRFKNCTIAFLEVALTNNNIILDKISITGTARCCPEDKYDFKIGKRIALARAEIRAYKYFKESMKNAINISKRFYDESSELHDKLVNQIAHNKNYIKDIVAGSNV